MQNEFKKGDRVYDEVDGLATYIQEDSESSVFCLIKYDEEINYNEKLKRVPKSIIRKVSLSEENIIKHLFKIEKDKDEIYDKLKSILYQDTYDKDIVVHYEKVIENLRGRIEGLKFALKTLKENNK